MLLHYFKISPLYAMSPHVGNNVPLLFLICCVGENLIFKNGADLQTFIISATKDPIKSDGTSKQTLMWIIF